MRRLSQICVGFQPVMGVHPFGQSFADIAFIITCDFGEKPIRLRVDFNLPVHRRSNAASHNFP